MATAHRILDLDDVKLAASIVGGRWKTTLLAHLTLGPCRFLALQRAVGGISSKVLAEQLRELEADGLVTRTVRPTVPPCVVYGVTPHAESLCEVVEALARWGRRHRAHLAGAKHCAGARPR